MELGPLSAIASQPGVTDIAVTCDGTVWADCGQGMQEVCLLRRCFPSAQSIREFAARLCSQLGRRLDDACPIADASTVDGLRVHAVIAPLVPQGAAISIRLPDAVSPNLESLARNGMFPAEWLPLLAAVLLRLVFTSTNAISPARSPSHPVSRPVQDSNDLNAYTGSVY